MPDIAQTLSSVPEPDSKLDLKVWLEKSTGDLRQDLYTLKYRDSTFIGAMEIDGSCDISSALYVDGSQDILKTLVCLSKFAVVGDVSFGGRFIMDGSADFSDVVVLGDITINGKIAADNSADFSDVYISGALQTTKCITDSGGYLDENNMVSDASAALASQQSIKAYVDTQIAANPSNIKQIVNTQTGAVATTTTTIPYDDTIPQNTEGGEFMTLAITPTSATNKLKIDVCVFATMGAAGSYVVAALFQDTTAGALACAVEYMDTAMVNIRFSHYMTAGTVSATTFKVRVGSEDAGTLTFNGVGGARKYGGVLASSITITEILV